MAMIQPPGTAGTHLPRVVALLNLSLLLALPFVWFLPLMRQSLPLLATSEISIASASYDLFRHDTFLFLVVFLFGMIVPLSKMLLYAYLWHDSYRPVHPVLLELGSALAKLSMTDIFALAIGVVIYKAQNFVQIKIMSGMYAFSLVALASIGVSIYTSHWFRTRIGVGRPMAPVGPRRTPAPKDSRSSRRW